MNESSTLNTLTWLSALTIGATVWWNDPDHGISSGYYRISAILAEPGEMAEDTIFCLKNDAGSEAEVYASELSPTQPEGLYPVVDSIDGKGSIYGYASSQEEAMAVGNAGCAFDVLDAYLAEDVSLAEGDSVPKAWVATDSKKA